MGSRKCRTPVASNTGFAITAPATVTAGSPPPCDASSSFLTSTASIAGTSRKRGNAYVSKLQSGAAPRAVGGRYGYFAARSRASCPAASFSAGSNSFTIFGYVYAEVVNETVSANFCPRGVRSGIPTAP